MASLVRDLINDDSTNPVYYTGLTSGTNKLWVKDYAPVLEFNLHTSKIDGNRPVYANFDKALVEADVDDDLRLNEPAYPPNNHHYRFDSERDGANWFYAEVSSIVMAGWTQFPPLFQQAEEKPISTQTSEKITVDTCYSVRKGTHRSHLAIGEFKRNILKPDLWGGKWKGNEKGGVQSQIAISQELRGYADKYNCPIIFCFDMAYMLILQFRAGTPSDIRKASCPVDCWILPRNNPGGTSLRYALYRILAQGFRRVQGMWPQPRMELYDQVPDRWEFFTGRPVFRMQDGKLYFKPGGCRRVLDVNTGAFYWLDPQGQPYAPDGRLVYDTQPFWQVPQPQQVAIMARDEDIYGM